MKPGMAILPGVAADTGAYSIAYSALLDGSTARFELIFGTPTLGTKWTYSTWLRRTSIGNDAIFGARVASESPEVLHWTSAHYIQEYLTSSYDSAYQSLQRDTTSWYHIVWVYDSTQAVAGNRTKLYFNNEKETAYRSGPNSVAQDRVSVINSATLHHIGMYPPGGIGYELDAAIAETQFVDGQALTPSDFGKADLTTGNWIPKKYTGTYGDNGFYLDFADAYDLGKDVSGTNTRLDHSGYTATAPTGGTANNAKDDNGATFVTTSSTPSTNNVIVKYDCGSAQTVSNVKVGSYTQAHASAVSYRVEYSTNDSSWTTWGAAHNVSPGNVDTTRHISDTETSARYWRLLANQNHDAAVSVGEFSLMSAANNNFTKVGTITQTTNTPTNTAATMNPLEMPGVNSLVGTITFTDGNRTVVNSSSKNAWAVSSLRMEDNTGIWYAEFTGGADLANLVGGIAGTTRYPTANRFIGMDDDTYGYNPDGQKVTDNSYTSYGDAYATDEVVGIELDTDNGTINFWNEGVDQGEAFSSLSGPYFFASSHEYGGICTWAFSEADLTHLDSVTNAKALTTNNLSEQSGNIDDHFKNVLYTGTGSSLAVTGVGFQPDFVWIKGRSGATEHVWTDALRGVTKELNCNDTSIEETVAQGLTAFGSDGFTVGTDGSYNTSSATYVAYCAKLDTTVTSGWGGSPSITPSKEIYNSKLGMSIIKWTGTGSLGTIPHSLGKKPGMMIFKNLDYVEDYWTTHNDIGAGLAVGLLYLDNTAAATTGTTGWNDTAPTDQLITVNTNTATNRSGDEMIAYIFAETEFCKIGSYTGNDGADGPFINMGISPVWSLIKKSSATEDWMLHDTAREPYNPVGEKILNPNAAYAEYDGGNVNLDHVANGLKIRHTDAKINTSGSTYIYLAFGQPNGPIENNGR